MGVATAIVVCRILHDDTMVEHARASPLSVFVAVCMAIPRSRVDGCLSHNCCFFNSPHYDAMTEIGRAAQLQLLFSISSATPVSLKEVSASIMVLHVLLHDLISLNSSMLGWDFNLDIGDLT